MATMKNIRQQLKDKPDDVIGKIQDLIKKSCPRINCSECKFEPVCIASDKYDENGIPFDDENTDNPTGIHIDITGTFHYSINESGVPYTKQNIKDYLEEHNTIVDNMGTDNFTVEIQNSTATMGD